MTQPAFVLVRPQMGENIGASARAMWNFGLDHIRIVAPRDGWPNQHADAMASGAGRLLDDARQAETEARVEAAVLGAGIPLGGFAAEAQGANERIRRGFRLILTGNDLLLLRRVTGDLLKAIERE